MYVVALANLYGPLLRIELLLDRGDEGERPLEAPLQVANTLSHPGVAGLNEDLHLHRRLPLALFCHALRDVGDASHLFDQVRYARQQLQVALRNLGDWYLGDGDAAGERGRVNVVLAAGELPGHVLCVYVTVRADDHLNAAISVGVLDHLL